jgi:hypothetical protein
LQRVSIFLEEKGLRKSFDNMLKKSLSFLNNKDSIPVLVMLESIHQYHITTFFSFLAPVKDKDGNAELDLTKYTVEYIKNNIWV